MEQKELEYLRRVEDHASRTGWVSPLTREDKEYFAYLRQVSKWKCQEMCSRETPKI